MIIDKKKQIKTKLSTKIQFIITSKCENYCSLERFRRMISTPSPLNCFRSLILIWSQKNGIEYAPYFCLIPHEAQCETVCSVICLHYNDKRVEYNRIEK